MRLSLTKPSKNQDANSGKVKHKIKLLLSDMFSIKITDPVIFSVIIFWKFLSRASLKNYKKNMKNFPGSPKYDAKHWTYVFDI